MLKFLATISLIMLINVMLIKKKVYPLNLFYSVPGIPPVFLIVYNKLNLYLWRAGLHRASDYSIPGLNYFPII